MRNFFITFIILSQLFVCAELFSKTPKQSIYKLYQKMQKASNFSVDAKIKTDIPMIKLVPVDASFYYKQTKNTTKFKIKSKQIALMPKHGYMDLINIIKDTNSFIAVYSGTEKIQNKNTQIINIIPLLDTGDIILTKIYLDTTELLNYKTQLTTKSNGTILIHYFYKTEAKKYALPDSIIFTVDVKKFKIPKAFAADINKSSNSKNKNSKKDEKGKIYIRFKNYKINQGIDDKIFK